PCVSSISSSFFFHCYAPPRDLPSFPTRRSSDLKFLRAGDGAARRVVRAMAAFEDVLGEVSERAGVGDDAGGAQPLELSMVTFERSEEHTSELQSLAYLVCRLLLEKKKKKKKDGI